ncbi:IS982 family transposase [Tissierella praeacuta]|uniref:IS982 family transposase n=1 Tax=Tissierella praeacuta TaxID=43131 RepID=UPI001C0F4639|nr:IS982 family transposase [Tissierella praeacuta]MBU5257613.1 IS982 family transposase [Tissierella praeacuta]
MLEFSNKYFIKEVTDLKDFITVVYILIDDIYQEITPTYIKERRNIKDAILSDSEIITISIVGELLTIDSEKAWLGFCNKNLRDLFPRFCSRTRFNRTRRALHSVIDEIRKELTKILGYRDKSVRIVDSIPIPVCKFGRAHFHKTFKVDATYGYCASKKETYYGFKLHVLATVDGYVTDFVLTPANIDDREAVWELVETYEHITILGDKGYANKHLSPDLETEKEIQLLFMKRDNAKNPHPKWLRQNIFKLRRRIETTFSQLATQLNINKVLTKSMLGLITRLRTKILAHNLCYSINHMLGNNINLGHIKELIFG